MQQVDKIPSFVVLRLLFQCATTEEAGVHVYRTERVLTMQRKFLMLAAVSRRFSSLRTDAGPPPPMAGGQGGESLSTDIASGNLGPLQSSLGRGPGASLSSSLPVDGAAQSPGQRTLQPSAQDMYSQPAGASRAGMPDSAPGSSLRASPPAGALLSNLSGLIPNQRGGSTQSG